MIYIYFFFDVVANDEVRAREGKMEDERGGRSNGRKHAVEQGGEQRKQMRGREEIMRLFNANGGWEQKGVKKLRDEMG